MNRLFAYFVKVFESDPRGLRRAAAAGACGLVIAVATVWRGRNDLSTPEKLAAMIMLPAFFFLAGAILASADATRRRLHAGARVGPLARLLFGAGIWSLLIWCVGVLIVGFPVAIWLGNMTWK